VRRLRTAARQAFIDVAAALFPGACRACGATLPPGLDDMPRPRVRRYAALWNGQLERSAGPAPALPVWHACPRCAATLVPAARGGRLPGRSGIVCPTAFEPCPLLFDLVHAFKYEAHLELVPWFARFMAAAARAELGGDVVLVPVPSHGSRRRERGFDASALLATGVASRLGAAIAPAVVVRTRATPPQARLAHAARAANVAGAFARTGRAPRRARLVVVDDVVTTGATVSAVLAALALPPDRTAVLALCRARDPGVTGDGRL
jgi:predicted amidophosphoribosyltransferase